MLWLAILILLVNLDVSSLSARLCRRVWARTRAVGGPLRVITWCAAVQSAAGFCSLLLPVIYIVHATAPGRLGAYRDAASVWYINIIVPVLGAGFILLIRSWLAAVHERSMLMRAD